MPCCSTRPSLCCTQVLDIQTFTSQPTKRTFNIFHLLPRDQTKNKAMSEVQQLHFQFIQFSSTAVRKKAKTL